jgi:HlyD family secretion protein
MTHQITRSLSSKISGFLLAATLLLATPALAADDPSDPAPRGPAVTVLKAQKACFNNNVEVSGIVMAREETSVRPDRQGLKVSEIMADAGDTVTAGQQLARLTLPEGGTVNVTAPVAGLVSQSSAAIGAMAGGKGEALFSIIARSEFDIIGMVPVKDLGKLQVGQQARVKVTGGGEVDGRVRRVAPTVEPNSQLGQVVVGITPARRFLVNSSGRALIKTGQSCNISVPLTAILYGTAGTVVQVIRRGRVETRSVETGLMAGGNVEIKGGGVAEGDTVVARAGALLREGDPVRPVTSADAK